VATEDSFQQFLRSQKTKAEKLGNLSDRKDAWLKQIDKLYEQVLGLLSEHIKSGNIKQQLHALPLYEELLGTYEVPSLVLELGTSKVQFKPIGTYLLGSPGRVDMVGLRSSVRIVLTTRDALEPVLRVRMMSDSPPEGLSPKADIADYVWKFSTNPPRIKYCAITRESLEKAIIEAVNG
jgi:hypothetical protein